MKNILLHNPYFIFFLGIFTIFVNIISSVHFFPILLAGVIFLAFLKSVKYKYYYSMVYLIIIFLFIEYNSGFLPFTFTLLSLFIYTFILPNLNRVISLHNLNKYIYILTFYIGVILIWVFSNDLNFNLIRHIVLNIVIDFLIYGLFL
ncbi:hypothetical protein [Arcobacter sp.]|uniref:hypothetical protein n=1 Tax=Arcobacter sp. TaxID=1872629 RepID=UPI003D141162